MKRADATRFLGGDWKRDARAARINMKTALVSFVKLYPDKFALEGNAVRSLEQDPRSQRLRQNTQPVIQPRGLIDAFIL